MSESDVKRNALVIGGGSSIGWAVANGLAAEGCRVTIADLNADGAAARAAELGPPHAGAGVDVTDEDTVAALFDRTGPLDVVVNTAGIGGVGRITEPALEQFRAVVDVCLMIGAFIVIKHAWMTGEVLDLYGGAHLKRYPDVLAHFERMMAST